MIPSPPDAALVSAGAPDAAAAVIRLVDRAGPLLQSLALRITGSTGDAADVVEQTLFEAWRHDPEAEPDACFAALARRCRDLALARSGKRAIGRIRRRATTRSPEIPESAAPDLDAARAAVAGAAAGLGPAERSAIDLVGFEGYAIPDLDGRAGAGGTPTRADLRRALEALPRLAPAILLALVAPLAPLDPQVRRRLLAGVPGAERP